MSWWEWAGVGVGGGDEGSGNGVVGKENQSGGVICGVFGCEPFVECVKNITLLTPKCFVFLFSIVSLALS